MAELENKENLSPARRLLHGTKMTTASPSPGKTSKKGRSKSIGPGGLDTMEEPKQLSPDRNRRKSLFAPAVKSILPSKEDEAKRRAARRKSLANRRVSFAPEATLHTWDVIEYMREATTSSTSSESTRRASSNGDSLHHGTDADPNDPPSTPPEQADEDSVQPTSPAHQRGLHQKKRRRSSAIPPMNFNNPDEDYSSSPVSGSSPMSGSEISEDDEEGEDEDQEDSDDDGDSTAMSLVSAENTMRSEVSVASTDSSARLDAALRAAAHQAGTRGIDYDENGDMSMEIATEEVTNAFKPWAQQEPELPPLAKNMLQLQEQENINPFSPAFRSYIGPKRPSTIAEEQEDDMSMDMTRAVGGIVQPQHDDTTMEDATMEFTQAIGKIYQPAPTRQVQPKSAIKRRLSTTDQGSPFVPPAIIVKSPQKQSQPPEAKRRRLTVERSSLGDATMDFTIAAGTIQTAGSPVKQIRRTSLRRRRSSGQSSATDEQTMDFTTAVGGIRPPQSSPRKLRFSVIEADENEELSMELTTALGALEEAQPEEEISRPVTPRHNAWPLRSEVPTTPKDQERFKEAPDLSAKKLLTPLFEKQIEASAERPYSASRQSPFSVRKSPARDNEMATLRPRFATPDRSDRAGTQSPANSKTQSAQKASPVKYPALPLSEGPLTPQASTPQANTPSQSPLRTPDPDDILDEGVPSPTRQKQLRSSPLRAELSPHRLASDAGPKSFSDNIKLLSTPRKDSGTSPLKRLKNLTPKKTPMKSSLTPGKTPLLKFKTPLTALKAGAVDPPNQQLSEDLIRAARASTGAPKVQLNKFLDTAGIRFMELTTTKRRYTVAPTPAKTRAGDVTGVDAMDTEEVHELEDAVVAGACTLPELDLYQHSCRELKRYISEGKSFLKSLEAEVQENQPAFIQAYMSASPQARSQLDTHLRDIKTQARLESKEIWYGWRSRLLEGLDDGLNGIKQNLESDSEELQDKEAIIEEVLPILLEQHENMEAQAQDLDEAAAAVAEEDKAELDEARKQLVDVDEQIEERKRMIAAFQQELDEQESLVEAYTESKTECFGAIQESDRIMEACRGWSLDEVASLQASVAQLERESGWSIVTASSSSLTMTYRTQLELFFDTSAFVSSTAAKQSPQKRSPKKKQNRPISLTYIADTNAHRPETLSTEKRFFLQLMRAQLQCLDQHRTSIKDLLNFVSSGWTTATTVSETIRKLSIENMVDVSILSDERLGIDVALLLPKVETKVGVLFELAATTGAGTEVEQILSVDTSVKVAGRVVYGEQYKQQKMGEFVMTRIGQGLTGWEDAVRDLKTRLVATGRKGT